MVDNKFYLVIYSVAKRSGVIDSRYRTKDGRFILETKDLQGVRLTSDEYVTGLQGVELISKQDAMILIQDNGYQTGEETNVEASNEEEVVNTPQEENEEIVAPENEETEAQEEGTQEEETPNEEEMPTNEENNEQENEQTNQEEE